MIAFWVGSLISRCLSQTNLGTTKQPSANRSAGATRDARQDRNARQIEMRGRKLMKKTDHAKSWIQLSWWHPEPGPAFCHEESVQTGRTGGERRLMSCYEIAAGARPSPAGATSPQQNARKTPKRLYGRCCGSLSRAPSQLSSLWRSADFLVGLRRGRPGMNATGSWQR